MGSARRVAEKLLEEAPRTGRLAQAYLISARAETAAQAEANRFMRRIFCENKTGCGQCAACRRFDAGNQVDFLRISPEGARIRLEQVRQIPAFLSKKTFTGGWRCICIEKAHLLGVQAQNFLLKSLEEPTEKTVFVLVSAEPEKLLRTVRSRCVWIRILPLQRKQLEQHLRERLPAEQASLLAAQADGMEEEAARLEKEGFLGRDEAMRALLQLMEKKPDVPALAEALMDGGAAGEEILWHMLLLMRDAQQLAVTGKETWLRNPDQTALLRKMGKSFTIVQMQDMIEVLVTQYTRKRSCPGLNARLAAENTAFQLMEVKYHVKGDRRPV